MTTTRADSVRGRLTALASAGLDAGAFALAAVDLLARAVPFESACFGTADPETSLLTGSYKRNLPDPRDAEFAQFEYGVPDINSFAEISRRPVPVGVLAQDTGGRPEASTRWREFLMPNFDLGHELRASIRSDGQVWGMLSLYRAAGTSGFSPAEADFLAGVLGALEAGLRAGLVVSSSTDGSDSSPGPAVIVIGPDDAVRQLTPAAAERLEEMAGTGGGHLPMSIVSIVAAARSFGAGRATSAPRARVRTRSGRWLVVHAAPLALPGSDEPMSAPAPDVVVTIEPAQPREVVPLLTAAYGLTRRENDVVRLVLTGASTAEISRRLHLSPYTVQDHLKSIFDKTGVRSRRELAASLYVGLHAARSA